jgi:hypothetical protein
MTNAVDHADAVIAEFTPLIRQLAQGRYAISIGGSRGKRTADALSDIDFRLWYDAYAPGYEAVAKDLDARMAAWAKRGVNIDGVWRRKIADIDAALDRWAAGTAAPDDLVWTVWGYHLVTDVYNQQVIEDPHGLLAAWRERLATYPPALKAAILKKHLAFVRYWRDDYHYANKVARRDAVFLAGLTSKVVHSLIQILFALNETYYAGDGNNLRFIETFKRVPPGFAGEVERVLYPGRSENTYDEQRRQLIALIDRVERLAAN